MDRLDTRSLQEVVGILEQGSNAAAKFGPFFFAFLFLFVVPFLISVVYKNLFASTKDPQIRDSLASDFKFYFRATVIAGLVSTAVGTSSWLFLTYKDSEFKSDTFAGLKQHV